MEADIIVSGIPIIQDSDENSSRIDGAISAFRKTYPYAIIEGPKLEVIGKSSQKISFIVTAPNIDVSREMHRHFEHLLVAFGFTPKENKEDVDAEINEILKTINSGSSVTYIRDSSNLNPGTEILNVFPSGLALATSLGRNMMEIPNDDQLIALSQQDVFMRDFFKYFNLGESLTHKKNLIKKLRKAPPEFKRKVADFMVKTCGDASKMAYDASIKPYIPCALGIVLISFVIFTSWDYNAWFDVIMIITAGGLIFGGSITLSGRKLRVFFRKELVNW